MYLSFEDQSGEYSGIPERTKNSLMTWVREGRRGGHFLDAVISNDLMKATAHADAENLIALRAICLWLYNRAPMDCFGSKERLEAWHAQRGLDMRSPA